MDMGGALLQSFEQHSGNPGRETNHEHPYVRAPSLLAPSKLSS